MALSSSPLHHLLPRISSLLPYPLRRFLAFRPLTTHRALPTPKPTLTFSYIFQHCSTHEDSNTGRAAHARMLISGFAPTVFVSNCLIYMYVRCSIVDNARKVFDGLPHRDTVSWNAMISGYAQSGSMGMARSLFDAMPQRDVISWNSLISGYLQNGISCESIYLFLQMRRSDADPDCTTFAIVLKSCSALVDYEMGIQIHGLLLKMGLDYDVVAGSALVDMYAKCNNPRESCCFFNEMPARNWVSWSAVIGGCIQNEWFMEGLQFFKEMQQEGIGVSQSVYASVLRSCAGLSSIKMGSQIHAHALKSNFSSDIIVGTAILDMYTKGGSLSDARRIFELLPTCTMQSWNAIIVGYARNDRGFEAMELFQLMNRSGVGVDEISLSGVFSACAEVEGYLQGLQVHCLSIKTSYSLDICVSNAVLDMYGKCGGLTEACRIFEEMDRRDAVSWNAVITALEKNDQYEETLSHFDRMLHYGMLPDEFTYGSVLKACAALQSLDSGRKVHDMIIKSGLGLNSFIGSALIDMYCKCGAMEEAQKLHERLDQKGTTVSWNAILSGFSLQKQSDEAQKFFFQMLDMGLKPDNFTYATVLDTCANLATLGLGKQIHAQIVKQELLKDVYISSTLVDMYAKCGNMGDSYLMFSKMVERDFVSWNAMICGYSQHGLGIEAIRMFERMQEENVRPNHATFVAVLRACGHVGLINEGECYFHLMTHHYKLEPQLEHYSCMVDLIGRSRGVHAALRLIDDMPCEADAVIWRTLLSACKIHGDVEVAELAAMSLLQLDPEDSAAYILLSNIYAEAGKWDEMSKMRRIMRQNGLKKEPGCSWIEVKNEMHAFLIGDKAHPMCKEIYKRLDELIGEMIRAGYVPYLGSAFDIEEEEKVYPQELLVIGSG